MSKHDRRHSMTDHFAANDRLHPEAIAADGTFRCRRTAKLSWGGKVYDVLAGDLLHVSPNGDVSINGESHQGEPDPLVVRPAEIARGLRPKLAKRLFLCAQNAVPWSHAMKSHRQLEGLGLVDRGTDGGQDVAVASPTGLLVAAELK